MALGGRSAIEALGLHHLPAECDAAGDPDLLQLWPADDNREEIPGADPSGALPMSGRPRVAFVESVHDGLRVTFGHGREAGTLFLCKHRFWKVRMDAGDWRWPDGIVVESTGAHVRVCQECELEFRTDVRNEVFCVPCDRRMDRRQATDARPSHAFGMRRHT
jgi:hypothetical protein